MFKAINSLSFATAAFFGGLFVISTTLGQTASDSSEYEVIFEYTGATSVFEVPEGVFEIEIHAWGAQGQAMTSDLFSPTQGGLGGHATGTLQVSPSQLLYITVGGTGIEGMGGFNGGGMGGLALLGDEESIESEWAGSGGGASDIRLGGQSLADRIIVAGGGGGGGRAYVATGCSPCGTGGNGGAGGGDMGHSGESAQGDFLGNFALPNSGGQGGSQSAAGRGGLGTGNQAGSDTLDGFLNVGGRGESGVFGVASGGVGGGYYGGGAGGAGTSGSGEAGGGGGGGSSYIEALQDATSTVGVRSGHGLIILRYSRTPDPSTYFYIPLKNGKLLVINL